MRPDIWQPAVHMIGAATGEIVIKFLFYFNELLNCNVYFLKVACLLRVPVEVVKQRQQAGISKSGMKIVRKVLSTEGPFGLYRGYLTTVLREIPFSFIQFPLWEGCKTFWSTKQGKPVSPWQSSICGAFSGKACLL